MHNYKCVFYLWRHHSGSYVLCIKLKYCGRLFTQFMTIILKVAQVNAQQKIHFNNTAMYMYVHVHVESMYITQYMPFYKTNYLNFYI